MNMRNRRQVIDSSSDDESSNDQLDTMSDEESVSVAEVRPKVTKVDKSRKKKQGSATKLNETDLECPKCQWKNRSLATWVSHLKKKHSTTPKKAGVVLLCKCGNKSYSKDHSQRCDVADYTVIQQNVSMKDKKREDKYRRVNNGELSPRCIFCPKLPSTMHGYLNHLHTAHKKTLLQSGIYLLCWCDDDIRSRKSITRHNNTCAGDAFVVKKVAKKEESDAIPTVRKSQRIKKMA